MVAPLIGSDRANYNIVTDIGTSAKMISIGQIEGFSAGSHEIMNNPASLYRQNKKNSVSLFSTDFIGEVHYTLISYARQTKKGTWGIAMMDAQVFDIPDTDLRDSSDGEVIYRRGNFNYREAVYKVAYQYSLRQDWHVGVSGAYFGKDIADVRAKGYNMDVGTIIDRDDYELSFSARNIIYNNGVGFKRSTDDTYSSFETLPLQLVAGFKYELNEYNLYGQTKWQEDNPLLGLGLDFTPDRLPFINVSGGYKEYLVIDKTKGNYVFGIGLQFDGISINYAYEKGEHIDFDNKSYFSVDVQF